MNQYELGTSGTDRITQILQSEAGRYNQQPISMLPPAIPSMMPEPISQPIPVQIAMRQKVAEGDPQATALDKRIKMFVGDDPQAYDAALQFLQDMPDEIDPANSYQVNTSLAQFVKQKGYSPRMPTPQQLHIQDLGNIASGKGTNYLGLKQDAEKNIADIAASKALAAQRMAGVSSGGGGTTMQVFRMLKEKYPHMDDMTLLRIAQNKVSQDTYIDPNTGQQLPISGAPEALGALKYGQNYGGNLGTLTAEGELAPGIAGATEGARQSVILGNAAALEEQKAIGSGTITDVQKKKTGTKQLKVILSGMRNNYNQLDRAGAIPSNKRTAAENLAIAARVSETGQSLGRKVGTPEQTIRDNINNAIPRLMTAIKTTTGMSAQEINAIPEMQLLRESVTSPGKQSVETIMYTLDMLEATYLDDDAAMTPPAGGLLAPDKQKRLQELRAKRDAGTLGK